MVEEVVREATCQVCGRNLLAGERSTTYVTRDGTRAVVCELCKPRAEAAGWMLPEEADQLQARSGGRERRRSRGQVLGGLLSRFPAGNGESGEEEAAEAPRRRPARAERARHPASERPPEEGRAAPAPPERVTVAGDAPGTTVLEALGAFNASNHRRTVAGLTRTLGPPRASALAIRVSNGLPGARLTVAWELTWYQWEIGPGPGGPEVRESGKGETIDQLRAADRTWNLLVAADGTLEQRSVAPVADAGEAPR